MNKLLNNLLGMYKQAKLNKKAESYKSKVAEMLNDINEPSPIMDYISESEAEEICKEIGIPHEASWYKGDLFGYIDEVPEGMVDVLIEHISEEDAESLWRRIAHDMGMDVDAKKQTKMSKKAQEKESAKKDYTEQYAKVKEIMKEYGYGLSDGGYIYLISKEQPKDEGFQVKFKGDRLRVELDGKLKYSGYGPEAIEDFLKGMFYAKKLSSKKTRKSLHKKAISGFSADVMEINERKLDEIRNTAKDMGDEIWARINENIVKIIAYGYEDGKLKIVYREPYYGKEEVEEMYENADEVSLADFQTLELQKEAKSSHNLAKKAMRKKAFRKLCLKRAFHKTAGEFEEMMKLKSTDPKLISYLAKEFGVEESTVSQYTDVSENAEELYNILEQQANKYGYEWDKFEYDEYGDRIDEDDFRGDTDDLEKAVEYLKNNIDKSMFKFEYVGTYEKNYLTFSVNEKLIPIEKPIIHITNYTKNYDISFFVESQKAKEEDKAEGIYTEDNLSILIRRTSDEILNEIVNYVNVELPKKIEEQNRKQSSKAKAMRKKADKKRWLDLYALNTTDKEEYEKQLKSLSKEDLIDYVAFIKINRYPIDSLDSIPQDIKDEANKEIEPIIDQRAEQIVKKYFNGEIDYSTLHSELYHLFDKSEKKSWLWFKENADRIKMSANKTKAVRKQAKYEETVQGDEKVKDSAKSFGYDIKFAGHYGKWIYYYLIDEKGNIIRDDKEYQKVYDEMKKRIDDDIDIDNYAFAKGLIEEVDGELMRVPTIVISEYTLLSNHKDREENTGLEEFKRDFNLSSSTKKQAVLQESENGLGYVLPNGSVVDPIKDKGILETELRDNTKLLKEQKEKLAKLEKHIKDNPNINFGKFPGDIFEQANVLKNNIKYIEEFNKTIEEILNVSKQATKKQAKDNEYMSDKEIAQQYDDYKITYLSVNGKNAYHVPNFTVELELPNVDENGKQWLGETMVINGTIFTIDENGETAFNKNNLDEWKRGNIHYSYVNMDKWLPQEMKSDIVYFVINKIIENVQIQEDGSYQFKENFVYSKKNKTLNKQATIKHENGVYNVYSESGKCLGKGYKTKEEAEKRLKQVEYFKHKNASVIKKAKNLSEIDGDTEFMSDLEIGNGMPYNSDDYDYFEVYKIHAKNPKDTYNNKYVVVSDDGSILAVREKEEDIIEITYDDMLQELRWRRLSNRKTQPNKRISLKQVVISKMAKSLKDIPDSVKKNILSDLVYVILTGKGSFAYKTVAKKLETIIKELGYGDKLKANEDGSLPTMEIVELISKEPKAMELAGKFANITRAF